MKKLILNSVKCLRCSKVLVSTHRHDYKTCGCPNETMIDGGLAYNRFGGVDLALIENLSEYEGY